MTNDKPWVGRERVYDFQGGVLQEVEVLQGPYDTPLSWKELGPVDCLPLDAGLALPVGIEAPILDRRTRRHIATIEIGVVRGKPACVAIRAEADCELTTRVLRDLKLLGHAAKSASAPAVLQVSRLVDGRLIGERHSGGLQHARTERVGGVTDEFLQEVAEVYRDAKARGVPTGRAIELRWPTSPANARRWIARARRAGFIDNATEEPEPPALSPEYYQRVAEELARKGIRIDHWTDTDGNFWADHKYK